MLERHALLFSEAVQWLSDAKGICGYSHADPSAPNDGVRELIVQATHKLRLACIYSDIDSMIPSLDRLIENAKPNPPFPGLPVASLVQEIRNIISLLKDSFRQEFYLHVDGQDVSLFVDEAPFGHLVAGKFPSAIEDITEAAKCLACQRPTAAVFHLMRVMELGVRALQKKLKVNITDPRKETWNYITDQSNKAINALPTATRSQQKRKQDLAVALAHLNSVRIAWRNEVMHPKRTYTREEAHSVYAATKLFMIDLSALI